MPQSYKIFINETPLVIADYTYSPDGHFYEVPENTLVQDVPAFMKMIFETQPDKGIMVKTPDIENVLKQIRSQLPTVVAAGGLVWNENNELLMIFRRGKWDLPKGKLDAGEDLESAALREVTEETAVSQIRIESSLAMMEYVYQDKGQVILKEIHWYKMFCSDPQDLVPQTEEDITKAEWVQKEKIAEKMEETYASVRELLKTI